MLICPFKDQPDGYQTAYYEQVIDVLFIYVQVRLLLEVADGVI
jgi:hypothetical protein